MASMLDKMDPEVAKKVLEQFPQYSNTVKEVFADFRLALEKAFDSNDKSIIAVYDFCDKTIEAYSKELERENLTYEQRETILDKMVLMSKLVCEKDSENKKLIAYIATVGAAALSISVTVLSVALGGNGKLNLDGLKKLGTGI